KRPAISSVKEEYRELENYLVQPKWDPSKIWPQTFSSEKEEKKFQPIEDETALSNGASLKNYKPDHKELVFGKVTEISAKPKRGIVERIDDTISNPHPLVGLLEMMINVEKLKDAPEVYPDFLGIEKMTTLIHSPPGTWKTTTLREIIMVLKNKVHDFSSLPCHIWVSYRKSLSNESKTKLDKLKASVQVKSLFHIEFTARPFVAILDEANAIMRQMSSGTNAQESENAICDVLRSVRHVLAMDAFANTSTLTFLQTYHGENIRIVDNKYQPHIGETVEFIYNPNSGAETMRIGYEFLRQGKCVAFVSTRAVIARALIEKASKLLKPDNLPVRAHAYYGDMDGKQRQKDFSNINIAWGKLDCVAYTNTVKAGISFEITGHFDVVIAITNIATLVHVEAFVQILYRIRDCPRRIVFVFYQKNSNELFRSPGHENIRAELESARPNNLPTAIKGHCEWNNNTISYKVDSSPAIITFIEVEHQKRLSARYFIETLCSLIASTGASLQLIKMDESRGVIGNRKRVCNEIRAKALVIKNTDFNAVATFRNLSHEEAEVLKFDQERSISDTIALKCFYIWNLYCKDMTQKHFLRLFYFRRQGHDEENAMKGLKAEENVQWKIACYKAKEHLKKSVAEDLRKSYSANHWKAIRELFQILGFTSIDDKRTLPGDTALESFMRSCERFIEIRNQSLLLFGFKSRAKKTPDLHLAIKMINAIASNWCGYAVESDKKRIGPKGQQPYDGLGFGDKGALELPPYRPKTDNNIQEVFDSIGQEK
ncbi:45312_t:CDS:2, partial [Gigaspora margarita]